MRACFFEIVILIPSEGLYINIQHLCVCVGGFVFFYILNA